MSHTLTNIPAGAGLRNRSVFTAAAATALIVFALPLFPRCPSHEWRSIYVVGSSILPWHFSAAGVAWASSASRSSDGR